MLKVTKLVATNVFKNFGKQKYEIKGCEGTTKEELSSIAEVLTSAELGTHYGITTYYNDKEIVVPAGNGTKDLEYAKHIITRDSKKAVVLEGKMPLKDTDLQAIYSKLTTFGVGPGNGISEVKAIGGIRKIK